MATYKIIEQGTTSGGKIEYVMELYPDRACVLTYATAQTQEALDAECDAIVAEDTAEAEKQAKIDKAIKEALWTDEERENLG